MSNVVELQRNIDGNWHARVEHGDAVGFATRKTWQDAVKEAERQAVEWSHK